MTVAERNHKRILIVGASVRSATQSAVRAGFEPICADLFGDSDLCDIANVHVIKDYPNEFVQWAEDIHQQLGRLPFIYTGGLENYPETVDAIARFHDLMGVGGGELDGESLRQVRDPRQVFDCLTAAEISCPTVQVEVTDKWLDRRDPSKRWLKKPVHSSAGFGISEWYGEPLQSDKFLQQYLSGPSVSILYVGTCSKNAPNAANAQLIGATLQLVGLKSLAGGRFGWCGSLGPLPLNSGLISQADRIGNALAERFRLVGIFGVDCIFHKNSLYPIEVNPRYTGSVEVLERSMGWKSIDHHLASCRGADFDLASVNDLINGSRCVGKAILFASRSISVQNLSDFSHIVADRPDDGAEIQQSSPVCTIMGQGDDMESCIDAWSKNVQQVHRHLFEEQVGFGPEIRRLWHQFRDGAVID